MPDKDDIASDPERFECDRCERVFHRRLDRMREWARGGYLEEFPDGTTKVYDLICNDCHRELGYH